MNLAEPRPRIRVLGAAWILSFLLSGCSGIQHPWLQLQARLELNRANRDYAAQQYENAIRGYQRVTAYYRGPTALPRDQRLAEAVLHRGYALMALQRGSTGPQRQQLAGKAIESLRGYLRLDDARSEIDPRRVEEFLFTLYLDSGRPADALRLLKAWQRRNPRDPVVAFRIAQHYAEQGDIPNAAEWYRKRIEIRPDDPEMRYAFGVFAWQVSYYNRSLPDPEKQALVEDGLEQLQRAIELRPDYFEAYSYVNLLYREMAKSASASRLRRKYTELADQNLAKALELRAARMKEAEQAKTGAQETTEGR
jgi:tetratricopeptide (TPR) repeat protein